MSQKKPTRKKPTIKSPDLPPKKDAKGGRAIHSYSASPFHSSTGLHFAESPTRQASLGPFATFSGMEINGPRPRPFQRHDEHETVVDTARVFTE